MQAVRRLLGVTAAVLSFIYLLAINALQMASVIVYPFSRRGFRAINTWAARSIWGLWVLIAEVQNKTEIRFVGDALPQQENALILSNHQSMADVMVLMALGWRCGRLGDMKWFVKDIVKYVPGCGWGMVFLDCIFVKRDWARDQSQIETLFSKFKRDDIPLFLVSFLEGTRRTKEKQARTRTFAADRGLYVPEHTLVPRTKGFVASIQGLRSHLDAVYDLTIGYVEDEPPTLINCFEARVARVEAQVRRYPIASLPTDPDELAQWALDRYREKDAALARFREDRRFDGLELPGRVCVADWCRGEGARGPVTSTEQPVARRDY